MNAWETQGCQPAVREERCRCEKRDEEGGRDYEPTKASRRRDSTRSSSSLDAPASSSACILVLSVSAKCGQLRTGTTCYFLVKQAREQQGREESRVGDKDERIKATRVGTCAKALGLWRLEH